MNLIRRVIYALKRRAALRQTIGEVQSHPWSLLLPFEYYCNSSLSKEQKTKTHRTKEVSNSERPSPLRRGGLSRKAARRLSANIDGIAAIEFALTLPILLTLFFGGYEYSRYMLIHVKMENISFTVSDIITQKTSITNTQLDKYMFAATQIMLPYDFAEGGGGVIISAVTKDENVANQKIEWQYIYDSTDDLNPRTSQVGTATNNATLPNNLTLNDNEMVLVAEVFYNYEPVFVGQSLAANTIYKTAIFKPRLGALTSAPN